MSDRSVMYKYKSGSHCKPKAKNDEKEEKNRNRHNNRHTAFLENRQIPVTPRKEIKASLAKIQNGEPNNSSKDRQKAFRDKFKQYLNKKANQKQSKSLLKPFLSTVAKGRFIDQVDLTARYSPKKRQVPVPRRIQTRSNTKLAARTGKCEVPTTEQTSIKAKSNGKRVKSPKKVTADKNSHQRKTRITTEAMCLPRMITSTVVRPKISFSAFNPTTPTKIFNDSISPVEVIKPEKVTRKQTIKSGEKNHEMLNISKTVTTSPIFQKNIEDLSTPPKNADMGTSYYVSPFVTISRGVRTSIRKEKDARDKKYSLESRKSSDFNNQSIEDRQKREAAAYFRLQVQRETNRLKSLVTYWRHYTEGNEIPSEYDDLVNVAIGQTNLLITSKFKQFNNLIDQCEANESEQVVKPEDLEVLIYSV